MTEGQPWALVTLVTSTLTSEFGVKLGTGVSERSSSPVVLAHPWLEPNH